MEISIIVNQLITLFIVIGLGYIFRKIGLMPVSFTKQVTKLLVNVTMPALIINAVLTTTQRPTAANLLVSVIVAIAIYVIMPFVGFLFAKILFVPKSDIGLYIYMSVFLNTGFMGFPLINALLGNDAMLYATIINIAFNLGCYSYGIFLVNMGQENDVTFSPRSLLTPGLILSVLAIVIYFIDLKLPNSVVSSISYVGGLTTPLAMLVIGNSLANIEVKELFTDWRLYIFTIIKQVLFPIAVSPLLKMFIKDETFLYVAFIMLVLPIANTSVLFATEYNANVKLAAKGVFISTLFSLITIPIAVKLCFG